MTTTRDEADFPDVDAPKTDRASRKPPQSRSTKRANQISIEVIAAWLGLMPDGVLRCPGQVDGDPRGEHTGVMFHENGVKCFHDRCRERGNGPRGSLRSGGFRTGVALVAEVRGVSEGEAARLVLAQFDPPPKVELEQLEAYARVLKKRTDDNRLEALGVQLARVCRGEPVEPDVVDRLAAALGRRFRDADAASIAEHFGRSTDRPVEEIKKLIEEAQCTMPDSGANAHTDGRTQIEVGPDLHRVVDEAVAELRRDKDLYQRNGALVRVVRIAEPDADHERAKMAVGTPQIRTVEVATLRERLTRLIRFGQFHADKDGDPTFVECRPDDQVVHAVAQRAEWPGVPPLVGIIETPTLRPDGSILDQPGYDSVTGYLYAPSRAYPQIPTNPTWHDANAALNALIEPWMDFPFADPAMYFVPVAHQLTIQARPAIKGEVPGFVYDASARGSGKTLAQKGVSLLSQGRECALATWPRNEEELEKVLGSYALRGASIVTFDNVTSALGGAPLDKVLTASDRVELRVLGKSEMPALPWYAVVSVSGNNLELRIDTTRRVLVARLEPKDENPEERTNFRIPGGELGFRTWCRENHPRMVALGLTLLRAYIVAGRPPVEMRPWTYGAWSALIPSAIRWAGGRAGGTGDWAIPDLMTCRPTVRGDADEATEALRTFLVRFSATFPSGATALEILDRLFPSDWPRQSVDKDLLSAFQVLCPTRPGLTPTTVQIGRRLRQVKRRVVGGKYLDSETPHGGAQRWLVRSTGG